MLKLYTVSKAGGCRSGSDSHGSVWHYVDREPIRAGAALCGAAPSIQWSAPWRGQVVTCKRCMRVARERFADDPVMWNPYNKVVQDHRDGTIHHDLTNTERSKRGLATPWTPQMAETEGHEPAVE